jgi:CRISPR/Cas system CSM-associated protein Csm2 small subunit
MNNMSQNPFDQLKVQVQEIIDLIAQKQNREANNKLTEVSEALDELLDHSDEDEDLIEISKYQVLLNQLFHKINPEDEQ